MSALGVDLIQSLFYTNMYAATLYRHLLQKLLREWHDRFVQRYNLEGYYHEITKFIQNRHVSVAARVTKALGRGARSKICDSLPASAIHNRRLCPLHILGGEWRQHASTPRDLKATHKRQYCHMLVIGKS